MPQAPRSGLSLTGASSVTAFFLCRAWLVVAIRRAQNRGMAQRAIEVPKQIGPCQFGELGAMIAVRCPVELAHILRRAGAIWEPGSKRWLVQRRRIGPVIRALQKATDPLFRRAGVAID
jgi:hypothetical protein